MRHHYNLGDKYDALAIFCMSKIETVARTTKVVTSICAMCGKKVKHAAEVNRHTMCSPCFSDYIEDRVGKRKIRVEKNTPAARSKTTPRARTRKSGTDGESDLLKVT